jgi:hypothetical protein
MKNAKREIRNPRPPSEESDAGAGHLLVVRFRRAWAFVILLLLSIMNLPSSTASAQGTAFTYQGRLNDNGGPANGSYDLEFGIWNSASGPSPVGSTLTNSGVAVSNGLFVVTLDFGSGLFTGPARWLEIAVRTNGPGAFSTLSPRTQLTATPYAITASNLTGALPAAQLTGTLASGQLSGTYSSTVTFNNAGNSFGGNGGGLTGLNANNLASGTVPAAALNNAWTTTGNSGTTPGVNFIGTTDNQPLELRVNGGTALVLQPYSGFPLSITAGSNSIDAGQFGAVIAGGDGNHISSVGTAISGGYLNVIGPSCEDSFIGGGYQNVMQLSSPQSVIVGGYNNSFGQSVYWSVIGGGELNKMRTNIENSVIGGGLGNSIQTRVTNAVIAGGKVNTIGPNVTSSTIAGGEFNSVLSPYATMGGGLNSQISSNATYATVGGGEINMVGTGAQAATISGGLGNLLQDGTTYGFIGGGNNNKQETNTYASVVTGGSLNTIRTNSQYSVIGGGFLNTISNSTRSCTIAGGEGNLIGASAQYASIPGGLANTAAGNCSFAAGKAARALHDGSFVWADSTGAALASTAPNQFLIRAGGGVGIGTTGPNTMLTVWTPSSSGVQEGIRINNPVGFVGSGNGSSLVFSQDRDTSENYVNATIQGVQESANTSQNAYLAFSTRSVGVVAEKMRIASGGNVGVGTASPQTQLHVRGPNFSQLRLESSTLSAYWNLYTEDNGPGTGSLLFRSSPGGFLYFDTAGVVHSASDQRLKRDIVPLGGVLDRLLQLRPVSYHMRNAPDGSQLLLGLIAQEVEPLFPEVVGEHAGMKSLAYSELVPVTIGAIQELNQKLDAKGAAIQKLEQSNRTLRERLEKFERLVNAHASGD